MDIRFGLTPKEARIFERLSTPSKIQDFLDTLPINFEKKGETHRSPRMTLVAHKAHCIEGALIAATALWYHGKKPLIMDLMAAKGDDDHVIALYQYRGYWGALSKSNHATIRYRDPVYKTLRELALSYFHEWFPPSGKRTLRSYSSPLNMSRFGESWITSEKDLWWLDAKLNALPHYPIAPSQNLRTTRRADRMERRAGSIIEWQKKDSRT